MKHNGMLSFWNFYVVNFQPYDIVFYFKEVGDTMILMHSSTFATSNASDDNAKLIFIAERERDGHCRAIVHFNCHYGVSYYL